MAGKLAQWVKGLTWEPSHPSMITEKHTVEGKNQLLPAGS